MKVDILRKSFKSVVPLPWSEEELHEEDHGQSYNTLLLQITKQATILELE